MKAAFRTVRLAAVFALFAPVVLPQSPAAVSGHCEGAIKTPDQELAIQVDLAKNAKGDWIGTISIPPQNLKGFPLSSIEVKGNAVAFNMKGPPGDPRFEGTLAPDGKSLTGNFTQGGASLTFASKRTGEAVIEPPAKSTAVTKELEGTWEGSLDANGTTLRLVLKMANQPEGAAGSITSLDQGGMEIPITSITQKDSHLKLELKNVGGTFDGDLKDGALVGQWTQGPGTLPLTFKRPAKPDSKK
jgi:hypothetical protein